MGKEREQGQRESKKQRKKQRKKETGKYINIIKIREAENSNHIITRKS